MNTSHKLLLSGNQNTTNTNIMNDTSTTSSVVLCQKQGPLYSKPENVDSQEKIASDTVKVRFDLDQRSSLDNGIKGGVSS
jgi:hypothetical protein